MGIFIYVGTMEKKKSFVLYCDIEPTIAKLTDDEAGKLFKHLLQYVNDKNPILDDRFLDVVFEPIKQSLKRDLEKRSETKEKRAEAGSLGWQARAKNLANQANASKSKQSVANQAVSVSVNVSDSDIKKEGLQKDYILKTRNQLHTLLTEWWYVGLSIPLRRSEDLEKARKVLEKKWISDEEWKVWIRNYAKDIEKRDKKQSYAEHRFTLLQFIKQSNWIVNFI